MVVVGFLLPSSFGRIHVYYYSSCTTVYYHSFEILRLLVLHPRGSSVPTTILPDQVPVKNNQNVVDILYLQLIKVIAPAPHPHPYIWPVYRVIFTVHCRFLRVPVSELYWFFVGILNTCLNPSCFGGTFGRESSCTCVCRLPTFSWSECKSIRVLRSVTEDP